MRRIVLVMISLALMFSVAMPQRSQAHGYYYNWWVPGAFFGGLLFGAAISRPWYYPPPPAYVYPPPRPVYAYPPPVYTYPPPVYAYPPSQPAYPAPNAPPPPRAEAPRSVIPQSPPGEWVTVPGQWVGDRWVPPHRAWVPQNP